MPRRALCESLGSPERLIAHVLAEAAKAAPSPAVAAKAAIATRSVPAASSPATVAIAAIASPAVLAPTAEQAAGLAEFSQAYVRRSNASREQRRRYGSYLADSRAVAEIGRASCRERVCHYGSISVVAISLKKKTTEQMVQ